MNELMNMNSMNTRLQNKRKNHKAVVCGYMHIYM